MYIREIHIEKFRHLENVHLGPFTEPPGHSDLIALAGPNGGGKSSILELIGYALSNSWSLGWSLARSFPSYSFEIQIAINPSEMQLLKEFVATNPNYNDALGCIEQDGAYYRSFNYSAGKYHQKASLFNMAHNLVSNTLRNYYHRPLGFFLKSDRTYGSINFNRNRLFEYDQIITLDYAWGLAFNTSEAQYRDIFEFLVQQRYHYHHKLGLYHDRKKKNKNIEEKEPDDPLIPYNDLLIKLFPHYEFAEGVGEIPTNLFVTIPSGETIPFSDLSSGEKEVFFILAFFLRQDVNNAIIVIDEPELHLHPELARLLIRTMQSVKPSNQIWLATHNPEIIDEAGVDRVIFVERDNATRKAIVSSAADEANALKQLKNFFGYSGYLGVAKKMVFLEGEDASSDRKMFTRLFPDYGSDIKFISSKSVGQLLRINQAVLSILEENLGWTNYYLIRDHDFLTEELIQKYKERSKGRIYVLERYHIENYLLNVQLIKEVQTDIYNKPISIDQIEIKLIDIVNRLSGEVLRDMIKYQLNMAFRSEDFSIGKILNGQSIFNESGDLDNGKIETLKKTFSTIIKQISTDLTLRTQESALEELVNRCIDEVKEAVTTDKWQFLFPGRRILEEYARSEGLANPMVLQNSLIKEMSLHRDCIPEELRHVIDTIVTGQEF